MNHVLDHALYLQAKNPINSEFNGALVSEWQKKTNFEWANPGSQSRSTSERHLFALSEVQNQKPSLHRINIIVEPQVFRSCIFSEEKKLCLLLRHNID